MIACYKGLGQPRGTPIHRTGAPEASARDNGAYRDTRPKSLAGIAAPHQVRPFLTCDHSVTELRRVSAYFDAQEPSTRSGVPLRVHIPLYDDPTGKRASNVVQHARFWKSL